MPVTEVVWLIRRSETVRSEVGRCPPFELVAVTLGYQLHTHTHTHTHIFRDELSDNQTVINVETQSCIVPFVCAEYLLSSTL